MNDNIVHLNGQAPDIHSAKDLVNHALSAHVIPRETSALAEILAEAEMCIQFLGGARATHGKMQKTTPSTILHAASSQSFQPEVLEQLNTLRLRFDDDYMYGIHFPKGSSIDFPHLMRALEVEALNNWVIGFENTRRLLGEYVPPDRSWLPGPLNTDGLSMVLKNCGDLTKGLFSGAHVRFVPANKEQLCERAQRELYTVAVDPYTRHLNITIGRDAYTTPVPSHIQQGLFDAMVSALQAESEFNGAFIRAHDPSIKVLQERIASVGVPDFLMDEHLALIGDEVDKAPVLNESGDTVVTPFRRR